MRILIAPGGPSLSSHRYGKEYYLLESIHENNPKLKTHSYFKNISDIPHQNVSAYQPTHDMSRNRYYLWSFLQARNELKTGSYDVYHHLNFHYRFFNPIMLAKQTKDMPIVLGPAQPPHTIPDSSKRRFIREVTKVDWSDSLLNDLLPIANWIQRNIYNRSREELFARTLAAADKVVVVNKETADLYSKYISRSKIEIIPYGVVLDRFSQGNPNKSTRIVAIGSLFERKGFDILINAWAEIAEDFPQMSVEIYGDGPQRAVLQSLAENKGVADSVTFHGKVEHKTIRDALSEARVFVHPSRSEGFPHVRLEAMASGCPVIASDIWGTQEMIRDGTDGIIVPTKNVAALSSSMTRILSNRKLAAEMGQNARERAATKFDWKIIGEKFKLVYDSVM